jgi:hypothetical protein
MLVNDPFDFVVFRADPVGFVPMDFRMRYRTIKKFDGCNPFEFPPVAFAILLPQAFAFSNRGANSNNFHIDDTANDLEFHASTQPSRSFLRAAAGAAATAAAVATAISRHDAAAEAATGGVAEVDDSG